MTDSYGANVSFLCHFEGANGSTSFVDVAAFPLSITATGNTVLSTAQKKFGSSAGYFDGNGDYLTLPAMPGLNLGGVDYTIEGQIYRTAAETQGLISQRDRNSGDGWEIFLTTTSLFLQGKTNDLETSGWTPPLNSWFHFAISKSGATTFIFIDGTQRASGTLSYITDLTNICYIGKSSNVNNYYFTGYMDEIRITKGIARYSANFTAPSAAFDDPTPGTGTLHSASLRQDLYDGGLYRIRGIVTEMDVPGAYRVRLFDRQSGRCLRQLQSAADGTYAFNYLAYRPQGYFAVAYDAGESPLNAAIADLIIPEPMP